MPSNAAQQEQQKSKLLKGALATVGTKSPPPVTIPFQYNPETLTRSLSPRMVKPEADRLERLRFAGAPEETLSVEAEFDSVDASGVADASLRSMGVYPQLSALELLVYPPLDQVNQVVQQGSAGALVLAYAPAPLTLFIWGERRVVPVEITGYTIVEQFFDHYLTPVRATVGIQMRVLSYTDLHPDSPGYAQFIAYQRGKEEMARQGSTPNGASVTGATY